MKNNKGIALIGIIVLIITTGIIGGGVYYYLSKQTPEISSSLGEQQEEITEPEEEVVPEEIIFPEEGVATPTEKAPPEEVKPETTCQNECSQVGLKQCLNNSYQVCRNYDADDCLEWGSINNCATNTICQNGVCVQQKCADGTPYGQCSNNKPYYCHDYGVLFEKCDTCECPTGETCYFLSGDYYCFIATCHTDQDCNDGQEKTINKCELSYKEQDEQGRPTLQCTDRLILRGNVKIAVVEYEADGTYYPENFLESLNNKTVREILLRPYTDPSSGKEMTHSFFSLYYLEDYFEQEAQRYGVNVSIIVDVLGPFATNEIPPFDEFDPAMSNFFAEKNEKYGLDLSEYDAIAYLYFTNDVFPFRWQSYAPRTGKNVYIGDGEIHIAGELMVYKRIIKVAHEITHKFGAGDRHIGGWGCSYPEGYVEPNKNPLYPQWEACLMCGSIPIEEKMNREPVDISEVIICEKTAEEIGWK